MAGQLIMDVGPFWERVFWLLIAGCIGGVGWLARSILKPWSDAALMRSKAFTDMVEVLRNSIPPIQNELITLKDAAKHNTGATQELTETLKRKLGTDSDEVCKFKNAASALVKNGIAKDYDDAERMLKLHEGKKK